MRRRRLYLGGVALLLIAAGVVVRTSGLGSNPIWMDEGESCIDALSTLDHGVPRGEYLGLPLFTNALIDPWPESGEYEFRDSNYSRDGFATYHGWLPIYAIAAALKLAGIAPDRPEPAPRVVHGSDEFVRRSVVPRLPSLLFAALFLLALFRLGAALGGWEVGLAVLAVAALSRKLIWFGQQARYYSATLALSAATALAIWNASRRGRWRDFLAAGALAALLFHTHTLSCVILAAAAAVRLPQLARQPRAGRKMAAAAAIACAAILPWTWWTGFWGAAAHFPRAWELLDLRHDLFVLESATRVQLLALLAAGCATALAAFLPRPAAGGRRAALAEARGALLFGAAWLAAAVLAFLLLIPAPSYSELRAVLVAAPPALLFAAVGIAALLRAAAPRATPALVLAGAAAYRVAAGPIAAQDPEVDRRRGDRARDLRELIDVLGRCRFAPGARLYGLPNDHLVLTYYTGLPVQCVAPVRRAFLESPPADVHLIATTARYTPLPSEEIAEEARLAGEALDPAEIERLASGLGALHVAHGLARQGARVKPAPAAGALELRLFERQAGATREAATRAWSRIPLLRGQPSPDWLAFAPAYAYRFVDPAARMGERSNHAPLVARGHALVLPSSYFVLGAARDGRDPFPDDALTAAGGRIGPR